MVNTALVTGHTEWDNLLLSFRAMVHTRKHTHTQISFYAGLAMEACLALISGQDESGGGRGLGSPERGDSVGGERGARGEQGSPFQSEQWSTLRAVGHRLYWLLGENKRRCDPHKTWEQCVYVCVCVWL